MAYDETSKRMTELSKVLADDTGVNFSDELFTLALGLTFLQSLASSSFSTGLVTTLSLN